METTNTLFIGVDLGGTNVTAGLVNRSGQILERCKKKSKADKDTQIIFNRIIEVIRSVADPGTLEQVQAIGIGSPGPLDPDEGIILDTPNLALKNARLGPVIQAKFDIPVFVDNDVNVGTLGEYVYGAGRGFKNVVGIFVGTGIGGGLILDGKLWHGTSKNAGEVGHIILDPSGPMCGCGNRGCLEAFASRKSIVRDIALAIHSGRSSKIEDSVKNKSKIAKLRSRTIAEAYACGDEVVKEVVDNAARCIGIAVKSLTHLLGVEMFILGGGVVEAIGEDFLKPIRKQLKSCMPGTAENVEIRISELGDDAGILGAAALARTRLEQNI